MTTRRLFLFIVAASLVTSVILAQQTAPQTAQPTDQQMQEMYRNLTPIINQNNPPRVPCVLDPFPSPQVILECDRAIYILNLGLARRWTKRDQFIEAFQAFGSKGTSGESLHAVRSATVQLLQQHLRTHLIWDEGPPIEVEVSRAIADLTKIRDAKLEEERAKDTDAGAQ